MAKRNKSKFLAESEATSSAVMLAPSMMTELFTPQAQVDESKVERRNLPPMLKPNDVPVWTEENPVILKGEIVKIVDSPSSQIKGKLIWLKTTNGHEVTFPCTGVVRNALAPGVKADSDELTDTLEKEIGKILFLKRTPDKINPKYKKAMFMFDVYTAKA